MPAVTHGVTLASTSNLQTYTTGSFTPAAGDLLVLMAIVSGTTADAGTPVTFSDTGGCGFSLYAVDQRGSGSDRTYFAIANKFAANAAMTVSLNLNSVVNATGCVMFIARVSGMNRAGFNAIAQFNMVGNQASGTPAISFGGSCSTSNPTLGAVFMARNPAAMTPPSSWTEQADTGYSTPTIGGEYVSRDSGFTGSTITWGNSTGSNWGGMIVELDATSAPSISTLSDTFTGTNGSAPDSSKWNEFGGAVIQSNQLYMAPPNNSVGYDLEVQSKISYSFADGDVAAVEIDQATNGDEETSFNLQSSVYLCRGLIAVENGALNVYGSDESGNWTNYTSGGPYTFSTTTHKYWRWRRSGTTLIAETSSNGTTWNTLGSFTPKFEFKALTVVFITYENNDINPVGAAIFDNFNNLATTQTLTPPLISAVSQMFAPKLALTITPPLISAVSQMYAPSIAPGPVTLTPPLISTTQVFAPTISPGPVTITPPLLASSSVMYAPTIAVQPLGVYPPLIASVAQLFALTISPGPVEVTPPLLNSGAHLFVPTITQDLTQAVTPPRINSGAQIFAPDLHFTPTGDELAALGVG